MMESNYSNGIEYDEQKLIANDDDPRTWTNPLESRYAPSLIKQMCTKMYSDRLPNAPSMKIYCVYGHGKDTEVSHSSIFVPQAY